MSTPSYKDAVRWIAIEDEPTDLDEESVSNGITVALVADLFDRSMEQVAKDVVAYRKSC